MLSAPVLSISGVTFPSARVRGAVCNKRLQEKKHCRPQLATVVQNESEKMRMGVGLIAFSACTEHLRSHFPLRSSTRCSLQEAAAGKKHCKSQLASRVRRIIANLFEAVGYHIIGIAFSVFKATNSTLLFIKLDWEFLYILSLLWRL